MTTLEQQIQDAAESKKKSDIKTKLIKSDKKESEKIGNHFSDINRICDEISASLKEALQDKTQFKKLKTANVDVYAIEAYEWKPGEYNKYEKAVLKELKKRHGEFFDKHDMLIKSNKEVKIPLGDGIQQKGMVRIITKSKAYQKSVKDIQTNKVIVDYWDRTGRAQAITVLFVGLIALAIYLF